MRSFGGPLGIKAALLLRNLEAAIPTPGSFEPCAGHGSYMPEHVILSGRRTMVIDLDEYDVADPARDLAWFIVSLERLGLKKRGSLRAHDQSVDAFQDAYRASGPRVAEPAEVHVSPGGLQDFRKVIGSAVRPPGSSVFAFTFPDEWSRPRMRQGCEVNLSGRDRGGLPVCGPARAVLVDDVQPEVFAMDDGSRCL